MISFIFNGKDSYRDFGILIEKRPDVPSPKRRVSYINIPGRNSSLRYDEKTYEDITLSVECAVVGNVQDRIDEIKAWLIGSGESDLVFSFQSDKKYIAQVVNSIDFGIILKVSSRFVIIFDCRPFKYSVVNEVINIYRFRNGYISFKHGNCYKQAANQGLLHRRWKLCYKWQRGYIDRN